MSTNVVSLSYLIKQKMRDQNMRVCLLFLLPLSSSLSLVVLGKNNHPIVQEYLLLVRYLLAYRTALLQKMIIWTSERS